MAQAALPPLKSRSWICPSDTCSHISVDREKGLGRRGREGRSPLQWNHKLMGWSEGLINEWLLPKLGDIEDTKEKSSLSSETYPLQLTEWNQWQQHSCYTKSNKDCLWTEKNPRTSFIDVPVYLEKYFHLASNEVSIQALGLRCKYANYANLCKF